MEQVIEPNTKLDELVEEVKIIFQNLTGMQNVCRRVVTVQESSHCAGK